MHSHKLTRSYICTAIICFIGTCVQAQVNIGIAVEPNKGSLLQLQNQPVDASNISATKGFGLPRVYLRNRDDISASIKGVSAHNAMDHTGLIIYNTNECISGNATGADKGVYVWNGSEWEQLNMMEPASGVLLFKDQEGKQFMARHFRTADRTIDAGIWMLENLRVASTAEGTRLTLGLTDEAEARNYCYPNIAGQDGTDPVYVDKQPSLGYLYNWAAATNNENTSVMDQGVGMGEEGPATHIQGICPKGWHLPSDKEWGILEEVMSKTPEPYSRVKSPTPWNNNWLSSTGVNTYNGEHGKTMKASCAVLSGADPGGMSYPALAGGFYALLVGAAHGTNTYNSGNYAHFWTSSAGWKDYAYSRRLAASGDNSITGNSEGVQRQIDFRYTYQSVRCKKDWSKP